MELDLTDPKLLLHPDILANPRPLYDKLRREAPVWGIPGQDSYLISDPALIREVVTRTSEFSSNLVSVLHRDSSGGLCGYDVTPFGDPVNILATADPPVHTRHRKLLQPHLSPQAISRVAPVLFRIVDEQLGPLLADGRGDIVSTFSDAVPARTICEVIGLPQADAPRLVEWVSGIAAMLDGLTDLDGMNQAAQDALDLLVYVQQKVDAAIQGPLDDQERLLAVLADAIRTGIVNADEARDLVVLLINAGIETTSSLLSTAVTTLAERPDFQSHLRSHPEDIPAAIEDLLRDDGPFQFHYRWATTDATVGDRRIPGHSRVLLMWAAANRPSSGGPTDTPADSQESQAPHFAFGRGIHFCIGAHLARLEGRVAIELLLARTAAFALDPERPAQRRPSIFLRRHTNLPILVEQP